MYEMKKPRCGVPDVDIIGGHQKRYATSGKWRKTNLKYYMTYGDDMSHDHQAKIMAKAFKYWSDVAPRLQFVRTNDLGKADFRIRLDWIQFCFVFVFVFETRSEQFFRIER